MNEVDARILEQKKQAHYAEQGLGRIADGPMNAGCSTGLNEAVRVPIGERLRRDLAKASRESNERFVFAARLEAMPGSAEMLDLIQTAFDLGYLQRY